MAAGAPSAILSEESEDFFADVKKPEKAAEVEQSDSSDSIPCSQNRPQRQLKKEQEKGVDKEVVMETGDPFTVDTVLDSESEEEEGTQAYEVFPALSRTASPALAAATSEAMEVDDVEDLLPSTVSVSPKPQHEEIPPGGSASQSAQPGQPGPLSQHSSQGDAKLSQHTTQQQTEHAGSQTRHSSQRSSQSAAKLSQPAIQQPTEGGGSQTAHSSQQQASVQSQPSVVGEEARQRPRPGSQTRSQDQQVEVKVSEGRLSQRASRQEHNSARGDNAPAISPEYPCPERTKPVVSPAADDHGALEKAAGKEMMSTGMKDAIPSLAEKGSQETLCPSPQLANLECDPFAFHGSQSQLVETEGAATSRAETSVSTLHLSKSKAKGSLGRRRKCLVKKKKEPNPRVEVEKSSSASTDNGASTKSVTRSTKKPRKGHAYTQLQQSTSGFKRPVGPARRASKDGREQEMPVALPAQTSTVHQPSLTLNPVTFGVPAKGVMLHQAVPSTSSAEIEPMAPRGGSQDQPKLLKRKSVEFSGAVQLGSSPQQFSLEASLSDSESSDTVLEVTTVTKYVMRYIKRITVVRHISNDNQVLQEKKSEEEGDHEVIEETELINRRRVPLAPSPSRSASTLTSGDLADISSSSLSNKANSGPSSLERAASSLELSHPAALPSALASRSSGEHSHSASGSQTSAPWRLIGGLSPSPLLIERAVGVPATEHSLAGRSSAGASPAVSFISPNQSTIERDDSRLDAVVTSSSSGRGSEPLYSADNLPSNEIPAAQPLPPVSLSSSSSGVIPPTADESCQQKKSVGSTPRSPRKSTRRAPADSSQEESKHSARISSPPESQSFLAGNASGGSGGFTVGLSSAKRKSSSSSLDSADKILRQRTETTQAKRSGASGSSNSERESADVGPSKQESSELDTTSVAVETVSRLDLGARVMCRWKDGCFYPAKFIGLNTGIGNKFKVLFDDGVEKTVRAVDLVMAQNLPVGQSVLVTNEEGIFDPGIIIKHVVDGEDFKEKGEVMYEVAMDSGPTSRCRRSQLVLSEDQASCLLSDEEYRATFGERDLSHVNTADVSLDNVILGKRLRIKGSPAVAVPRISKPSTSTAPSDLQDNDDKEEGERVESSKPAQVRGAEDSQETMADKAKSRRGSSTATSSARKRKMGPVATSTPTPKQTRTADKQSTPKKAAPGLSPLGAAVESPENKRPVRKARVGLFENSKGPIPPGPGLFTGYFFLLTHVDKHPNTLAEEKRQLQDSSIESSTEESTDDGGETNSMPFDKEHLQMQIEAGGGTVLSKFDSSQAGSGKKLFLISDTHQRTGKYILCLAANVPSVSHMWIRDSCLQNQLLDYKDYVLPAGISLEKHKLMERVYTVSCLAGQRVLLHSTVPGYTDFWTTVLDTAHCKVLTKFPPGAAKNRPGVDVVVTDHTCANSIADKARQLGVPVVASEWVIQCLINNTLLQHDGHPMYAHDYYKEAIRLSHSSGQQQTRR